MKVAVRIILGLLILAVLIPTVFLGQYVLSVQCFEARPSSGYHADFYLYTSPAAIKDAREGNAVTILVQPNNSGTNSDDPKIHERDAWWTGFERQRIADELGVILLVPAFIRPGQDWHIYTHALDRDSLTTAREDLKRNDLQLISMIEHARETLAGQGIPTDERILIQGFSASGMFANRFTLLHPERVKGAAIGSPGGWPVLPVPVYNGEPLPYPAGTADLNTLTGIPFESDTYNAIPQLIYMGSMDDNDSLDFTDGWDEADAQRVDRLFGNNPLSRWEHARTIYEEAGTNVQFLLVDGVGHDRRELQEYSTDFFRKILNNE